MKKLQTEVLVIGGGATGTGIIRDLAMRGLKCVLVEKRDFSNGTTGRFHGLLHSGGRYVVKDLKAARECIEENRILRKIMPHCIEDSGGFFIVTPWDDPNYAPLFIDGCMNASIPVEEVSINQMLREEPNLNPKINLCFRVPDGSADSFLASELNAESAQNYGGQILTYHEVTRLESANNRVFGAICLDLVKDENVQIMADMVVLAAGAWAGKIASTVGVDIQIISSKGTMIAVNHRIVNTVINRCKLPSDGDILVPIHSVSIMGTTDIRVNDPDHYAIDQQEIHLLIDEGEKIIPGFRNARILRAWAGVRPLFQETSTRYNREVSRAYVLLDHAVRDGIEGLVTITSGKWTTYRKMAEVTSDLVCAKLRIQRSCKTHLEDLPGSQGKYHYVGDPLIKIEEARSYGSLICECELATYDDVIESITQKGATTIDDIRRDIRLGMGPCQGGYCAFRVTGMLHDIRKLPVEDANNMLFDFLRERWKGLIPILWGSQLRQERVNELIYINVLNVNQLPGKKTTRLGPTMYEPSQNMSVDNSIQRENDTLSRPSHKSMYSTATGNRVELLIIGGGLAGLTSALITATNNKKTRLITKGWGSLYWQSGCIDILGHSFLQKEMIVSSPIKEIEQLITHNPDHPYALVGIENINESIEFFKMLFKDLGYPLAGTLENNWLIPNSIGSIHPTCLAPETMIAGDMHNKEPMLIIGIEGFNDFFPGLVCENLISRGVIANHKSIKLNSLKKYRIINSMLLARLFEEEEFREEVSRAIKPILGRVGRIGIPAVLGIDSAFEAFSDLQEKLDINIFEIPGIPPAVPGIRLHNYLVNQILFHGGRVYDGMEAIKYEADNQNLSKVYSEAASRIKPHSSDSYVLATGGILGGGLRVTQNRIIRETLFGLPIISDHKHNQWFNREFTGIDGHPVFGYGVRTNHELKPVDVSDNVLFNNLYAAGSILGNCDPVREISSGGIAISTAYKIGKLLINQ